MGKVNNILPAPARGLHLENQVSVDHYLTAFKKYSADHNIVARVKDLTTTANALTAEQCKIAIDVIDRDITRAVLHAEKEAKRPAGKYAWSPKLREAGLLARYWHLRLREIDSASVLSHALASQASHWGSEHLPR